MTWLWESWEEYCKRCHPVEIRQGRFRLVRSSTKLQSVQDLADAAEELAESFRELKSLDFKGKNARPPNYDPALVGRARDPVIHAIHAGETLLLYHKRLALSEASYGFLHQNDFLEHWDKYVGGQRIIHEIQQLVEDVGQLLEGYQRISGEDERFLVGDLDLPKELEEDFNLSRNLFSVGFDEVGLFIAARGLEKVLRRIAFDRKIELVTSKKTEAASEAELHDLIETMSRVRWKVRGVPLVSRQTKALLQYIRTLRNSGAHSGGQESDEDNFRQTAAIIARSANSLWNSVARKRARLEPTSVQKNWP